MKILNLYAGLGGNRRAFSDKDEVTAIEWDEKIANVYKNKYPNDEVIITDAHKYLLEHYEEYDFIWSSPPCPTHSRIREIARYKHDKEGNIYEQNKPVYPDMTLYQEILFLDNFFEGKFVVENVIPYYEPLIKPQKLGRHLFWSNVEFPPQKFEPRGNFDNVEKLAEISGYTLDELKGLNKRTVLRNCVEKDIAEYIYKCVKEA